MSAQESQNTNIANDSSPFLNLIINTEVNAVDNCFLKTRSNNIFQNELDCLFDKAPDETFVQIRKRVNDFDSSLILENAQKTVNNQSLKIELKISTTEKELQKVQDQINLLELLNLDYDKCRLNELYNTKEIIENQIAALKNEYKKMGIIYKISDDISELLCSCKSVIPKGVWRNIIKKAEMFLPFLKRSHELSSEIQKLKLLHQKLSEKPKSQAIPYGEKEKEINNFIAFWSKAKQLDAKITKMVNG